jgi:hypothetical protein
MERVADRLLVPDGIPVAAGARPDIPDLFLTAIRFAASGERVAVLIPTNGVLRQDHTAVMGSGLSRQAAERFPGLEEALGGHIITRGNVPGVIYSGEFDIVSFPTKRDWRDDQDIDLIERSSRRAANLVQRKNYSRVLVPKFASGQSQHDWESVRPVIERYLVGDTYLFLDEQAQIATTSFNYADAPRFGGMGSRATPPKIQNQIVAYSRRLTSAGYVARSRASDGADLAFERGAGDRKEIWLPWAGFEDRTPDDRRVFVATPEQEAGAVEIASRIHPTWEKVAVRRGSVSTHASNVIAVLGPDLTQPVDFLVLWAPVVGDSVDGDARTSYEAAKLKNIPTFNLNVPEQLEAFEQLLSTVERGGIERARMVLRGEMAPITTSNSGGTMDTEIASRPESKDGPRYYTLKDPETRFVARQMRQMGGEYNSVNSEWIFPGSKSAMGKPTSGAEDMGDALLELYHNTRPTPDQMAQLKAVVDRVPLRTLGISVPPESAAAKAAIKNLLNAHLQTEHRVGVILAQAAGFLTPASQKDKDMVGVLIERGYDKVAWGFDAKQLPHRVWMYDGAPELRKIMPGELPNVAPTKARANELFRLARPYVEADRRREEQAVDKGILTGDMDNAGRAIDYARVGDVNDPTALNVINRVEAEGMGNARLSSLDDQRSHQQENRERVDHGQRENVVEQRGFAPDAGAAAFERRYQQALGMLKSGAGEVVESETQFDATQVLWREPRDGQTVKGNVISYVKVPNEEGHFLMAVQSASSARTVTIVDTSALDRRVPDGSPVEIKFAEQKVASKATQTDGTAAAITALKGEVTFLGIGNDLRREILRVNEADALKAWGFVPKPDDKDFWRKTSIQQGVEMMKPIANIESARALEEGPKKVTPETTTPAVSKPKRSRPSR